MTYKESLEYIDELKKLGSKPGLSRVTELAAKLHNPQDSLKIIHVTGTNGKGSVCAMLDVILQKAGYKTGRFSSPWIERINEYISLNGKEISDDEFAKLISEVKLKADEMIESPTEFEMIAVAALIYFKQKKCDIVIMETGMGGLSDATNFIEKPILSIITGVAIDHTKFLGETIEEIAAQKAGIIKEGIPVLFGGDDELAYKVIEKVADQKKSEIYRTAEKSLNIISSNICGNIFEYRGLEISIPLAGVYQPKNAMIAIDAADILSTQGVEITDQNIIDGLKEVKWKGRFEVLRTKPVFIFDGGHNVNGILNFAKTIKDYYGDKKVNILTGVMKDKEYKKIANILALLAEEVFTVTPDNPRALVAKEYAENFKEYGVKTTAYDNISDAVKQALVVSEEKNIPLIAIGSLYMYKDVKKASR